MSILQEAASKGGRPEGLVTPPGIDLRRCPPDELAAWLLAHRFQDDAMDVAKFLLNCTSALPDAEEISARLLGGEEVDDDDDDCSEMEDGENDKAESEAVTKPMADSQSQLLHDIATSPPLPAFGAGDGIEVSCVQPRGKFLLSVHKNGVVLINPKKPEEERIPLAAASVENVVWFRRPEDYKKVQQMGKNGGGKSKEVPGHVVLICLAEDDSLGGIAFRKKPLTQVCFQLPAYPPSSLEDGNNGGSKQLTKETWWNGLGSALFSGEKNGIVCVHAAMETAEFLKSNNGFVFESEGESGSATTTQAMPYVGCYQGFNDGALFPLREGLLFFKPPLFVPRSKLASISCGRGSGGSRYVDMVVQLELSSDPTEDEQEGKKKKKQSDETLEFTNIHRDELTGLNDYIHKTLIPAMQMDADGTSDGSNDDDDSEEVVAEVVNSKDADEDRNGDSDEEEGRKGRPPRAASKSAREITRAALQSALAEDEDDDEEDEFEEEESDESDESVVSDEESQSASSDDGEEGEEEMDDGSDGSDYEDRKARKKARVE